MAHETNIECMLVAEPICQELMFWSNSRANMNMLSAVRIESICQELMFSLNSPAPSNMLETSVTADVCHPLIFKLQWGCCEKRPLIVLTLVVPQALALHAASYTMPVPLHRLSITSDWMMLSAGIISLM